MPNDDAQEKELLERYRRASNADTAAPGEAVRAAILAEGRRAADARAKELRAQPFDASRPAANDSRWKITAFGTAGAALLAVFLFAPRLWETAPPSPPRSEAQSQPDAPAEKIAPQNYSAAPNAAEPPAVASSSRPPAFTENAPAPAPAPARAAPSPMPSSLSAGRVARMRSEPQQQALQSAAASGDAVQAATLLDQGAPLDARDEHGRTALMRAVRQNKLKVVRLLLDRGADPNLPDNSGSTPLQQAKRGNLGEIAAMLEAAGAR
jgi:Ankyrin repeats (many copies)